MLRQFEFTRGGLRQVVSCRDLLDPSTIEWYRQEMPERVNLVYSDPPWNPGNEKYWRNHAEASAGFGYTAFLNAWHAVVAMAVDRGASDVLTEQSANHAHHGMFLSSRSWTIPEQGRYTVYYGSPGSRGAKLPNLLLHFGSEPLATDPSGMAGEPMTIRACAGLRLATGSTVVEPCLGKGMTSRMAHYFGWNLIGTELNAKRLDVTMKWLIGQGYQCREIA